MSNFYFTPIATGESNSPDTINVRLGGLDSAIAGLNDELDGLVVGAGTSQAETIAARTGINYKSGTPPPALAVTLYYAANDTYNVLAYGAVGNGVADDRAAIQAAIDAANAAGGGIVFLPRGTYKLTSSAAICLTMHNNVTLRGAGTQTILDFAGNSHDNCITLAGCAGAVVENLFIRNSSAISAQAAIVSDASTVRMRLRNVLIRGLNYTKSITNIVSSGGMETVTAPAHGFLTGNNVYVYGTATNGANSLDLFLDGITVVDADTFTRPQGIVNNATTGVAQRTAWTNCILILGTDAIVQGCDVGDAFYTGIRVGVTALRATVIHNTISGGFRGSMWDDGSPGAAYCIVAHNHYDSLKQAMGKVESTCTHNHICDNIATNCSSSAYAAATFEILGPYTTFDRNHLFFTSPQSDSAIDNSTITAGGHIAIRDNIISGHPGIGINIQKTMNHGAVSGNMIDGAATGIQASSSTHSLPINYIHIVNNRITNSLNYGIYLSNIFNFVVHNNTIVTVTNFNGIRCSNNCNYGSIIGNLVASTGTDGFVQGDSADGGKYLSVIGNVFNDVGNSGAGYNISISANATKIALIGNINDDTPETASIRGSSVASVAVVGNASQKQVNVTGTTVSAANNL